MVFSPMPSIERIFIVRNLDKLTAWVWDSARIPLRPHPG